MPTSVVMPALEIAQETGKLISWLRKEGDTVAKGQPLLEIETDKAVMEVDSPADGILAGIKVQPGADVPVGETIAWIVAPGEAIPAHSPSMQTVRTITVPNPAKATPDKPGTDSSRGASTRISPKARRLAAEQGVDLTNLRGSGPDGEILATDILCAAHKPATGPPANTLSTVARLMAERTTQSWTTVPHFFVVREVDATTLREERHKLAPSVHSSYGVKLTYTDLLVALVARVLARHPRLNASWAGDRIRENPDVNIAIAIAVDDGVVAPVIRRADTSDLGTVALQRHQLTEKARNGKLQPTDVSGGTFTISNLGMLGIDAFSAVIVSPQAAILAIGRILDRVVAVDSHPTVRPMMTLTLSSDHRVVDGARVAKFLQDLAQAIENPCQVFRALLGIPPVEDNSLE
jgi:pyruvate dehydrogenase E2 component (dihydrolipoyllysine-residue acetyltransferase)